MVVTGKMQGLWTFEPKNTALNSKGEEEKEGKKCKGEDKQKTDTGSRWSVSLPLSWFFP